ncbi:MAG: septum site-determining protein MinC [Trueperaceae bacterium]
MKARGIRGGILLSFEPDDDADAVRAALDEHRELLEGKVSLEIGARTATDLLDVVRTAVDEAGGDLTDLRPPTHVAQAKGETVILAKTVRSGGRIESTGSVVILGDVNAGAEIVATDDIIVIGTLRGLAHAGAHGNRNAVIWAHAIRSPQLRIGAALAQAEGDGSGGQERGPEVAHLREGQIVLRPWGV